ncbi:DUF4145 domain-containing protein [Chlorobaculum thiosulfatiphilum]|uniref:DUF4145 domain-containing protein n=1 Tax=Chlorobaculum thiosulfatiphilum TaxID=115852 RepID=A0A5C4S9G2_CHLTI|nr:DUF4145 domain-containing protein [Chlorobaculum thiosulfatiphilum]TNJ39788.1 DUF4145 domain-containing protein [Chlorobaculum thiosulfatiphilum]
MLQKLSDRFDQLLSELTAIELTIKEGRNGHGTLYKSMDKEKALTWKVKVKNLLIATCGEKSQHFQEITKIEDAKEYYEVDRFKKMKAVFIAAMDDYKGGYLTSIKNLIQADVFDSELDQANGLLSNGYKLAAAVIAGVVLETSLRDLCNKESLPIGKLDKMNADLAKAGIYNKLQQKRITALADIRNSAAHGKPEEFTESDVETMIRDIEQFLATHLA